MNIKFLKACGRSGNTLIEVLVVTTLITVVMTGVVAGLTFSLKNSAEARYREYALNEAQEALEVFRRERVAMGWLAFSSQVSSYGTICFNDLPHSFFGYSPVASCDYYSPDSLGTDLRRTAQVTNAGGSITVLITVEWSSGVQPVEVKQVFRDTD